MSAREQLFSCVNPELSDVWSRRKKFLFFVFALLASWSVVLALIYALLQIL